MEEADGLVDGASVDYRVEDPHVSGIVGVAGEDVPVQDSKPARSGGTGRPDRPRRSSENLAGRDETLEPLRCEQGLAAAVTTRSGHCPPHARRIT